MNHEIDVIQQYPLRLVITFDVRRPFPSLTSLSSTSSEMACTCRGLLPEQMTK